MDPRSWIPSEYKSFNFISLHSQVILMLDGDSEIVAHVKRNICYSICLRHLSRSRAVKIIFFICPIFLHACATCGELPSYVSTMVVSTLIFATFSLFMYFYINFYFYDKLVTYPFYAFYQWIRIWIRSQKRKRKNTGGFGSVFFLKLKHNDSSWKINPSLEKTVWLRH